MKILLTGGTGYIGSHVAVALVEAGHTVVLFDNLSNSSADVVDQLEKITRHRLVFVEGDIRDTFFLIETLRRYESEGVINLAGLKAVGESVEKPVEYYANNVQGSISLLQAMQSVGIKNLVFSSSATVYGEPQYLPIDEHHPTLPTTPYGRTKLQIEEILKDVALSDSEWRIVCLRYFNPVGSHESGLIGECPNGVPNNLFPYIVRVASGEVDGVKVFGNDYSTHDGTGIRDYIHVMDLAEGHVESFKYIENHSGWNAFNLGAEVGFSVLEVVKAFQRNTGKTIPYLMMPRRQGDVAICYANSQKAQKCLGWSAKRSIDDMCASAWQFKMSLFKT